LADGTTESTTSQINRFIEQAELGIYNTIQFPSLRSSKVGTVTAGVGYLSCPDDFLSVYSLAVYPTTGPNANTYTFLINKDVNFIREAYPNTGSLYYSMPQYYALFGPQSNNINELSFILGPTPDQAYATELNYYYYPPSIIQGNVTSLNLVTAGSGYVNGTYYDVPFTGGNGNSCLATIKVTAGVVASVTVTSSGALYIVGDTLSVASSYIGASGSGFTASVISVGNTTGTSWLGDNFDSVLLYGSLVEAYTFMKGEQDLLALYETKYKESLMEAKRLGDGLERQDAYRSGQYRQPVT
jgi:hypothetical protein